MTVTIEADAKEIAALVVALQERQMREFQLKIDGKAIARTAIDDMRKAISEST